MERELARWGGSMDVWRSDVERLRAMLTNYDHWSMLQASLVQTASLTETEAQQYFSAR